MRMTLKPNIRKEEWSAPDDGHTAGSGEGKWLSQFGVDQTTGDLFVRYVDKKGRVMLGPFKSTDTERAKIKAPYIFIPRAQRGSLTDE